ncbi:MAG: glycosyltransferase family 4 protein [Candidatus Helarchaeota archaeon]
MRRRKKIAIVVSGLPPIAIGGTEIATSAIAKYLIKEGFRVYVVSRNMRFQYKGKKRTLEKVDSKNGYKIYRILCSRLPIFRFITQFIFSVWALVRISPDIIQGHQILPNGLITVFAGKILRRKTIVYARGGEVYNSSILMKKVLLGLVIKNASCILTVSRAMTRWMKKFWPNAPISTLHNGIELENYYHESKQSVSIDLIYIGRLIRSKNVTDAIRVISYFQDNEPPVTLTIVGTGPLEKELKQVANKLGVSDRVRFIGKVPHNIIPRFLAKADLFIFPSTKEGFPNAILEAMGASLPILASNISGVRELVQNGVNGYLHTPEEIEELKQHLQFLIENEAKRGLLGAKSRELAAKYKWDRIIQQLIQYY